VYLQQFDFEIKYRKRILNKVADALSRSPVGKPEDEVNPVSALEDFVPCPWYSSKKTAVEKNLEAFPDFCVRNGSLYRHFWNMTDLTENEMADPWKVCVPKDARKAVLEENHSQPTAGHQGIAKTIARIARRYY